MGQDTHQCRAIPHHLKAVDALQVAAALVRIAALLSGQAKPALQSDAASKKKHKRAKGANPKQNGDLAAATSDADAPRAAKVAKKRGPPSSSPSSRPNGPLLKGSEGAGKTGKPKKKPLAGQDLSKAIRVKKPKAAPVQDKAV